MSTVDDNDDGMTASFSASTFESDVNDPWTSTTRGGLNPIDLSTILSGMRLPAIYTTAFDLAQPSGGKVTVLALNKILAVSGLPPATVDKILNIVVAPTRSRITKGECSVALALVAMAQKNMDLTIENLTAHREDLPIPHLPGLQNIDFGSSTDSSGMYATSSSLPKGHPVNVGSSISDPWRTSTYKGNGYPPPPSYLASPPNPSADLLSGSGSNTDEASGSNLRDVHLWFLNLDVIRITFAPEKEGIFLFKHTNYIVESKSRQTTVIRRYSDFWWLLDILAKRFPYRILPNLPPKRLGVADEVFLERRLRGLTRFTNALMRHPVLKNDPLVISFLTEPVELALWRKNVVISTEDEFTSKLPIPESLVKQVPMDLELQLESIKRRLPASVEYYRSMVHVMDRVQKRTEANAGDYMRFSLALNALADCEKHCHVEECYSCGQLSHGYGKIGSHMGQASNLLEEQARATQRGIVEDLKRHRDLLVSVMELMQRRERAREGGLVEMLKKRIANQEQKLTHLRTTAAATAAGAARAEGAGNGGYGGDEPGIYDTQIEKLVLSIQSDRAEMELQNQRVILINHTLWMEILFYHKNQASIASIYQNFVHEQIKTSQSLSDTWESLSPIVHDLPMEVNAFN
ncbi:Sorting nexin mvp1 [Linnemannia exigua]|uniref:Sorting nexin MVP1 n=1 Tax=Linnemannia exigua TaxID=604196 RepID=A0AAD4H3F7_9FUNG|nr:Sorting nexin mvp1 [Linnemannia exigua]